MKILVSSLLLLLVYCSDLRSQNMESDSLIQVLNSLPDGEQKLELLLQLSDMLNWQNIELATQYIRQAITLAKTLKDKTQLGHAYEEYSENLWSTFPDSATYYLEKARSTWKEAGYTLGEANILATMASEAESAGRFDEAMRYLMESTKIYEAENDLIELNNSYVAIGGLFESMGRYEDALEYTSKSEAFMLSDEGLKERPYYYLVLGKIYWRMGDCEKAIEVYSEMQILAEQLGYYNDFISASVKLGDCYLKLGNTKESKENYLTAVERANEFGSAYFKALSRVGMSDWYMSQGEYSLAASELELAKEVHRDPVIKYFMNGIYKKASASYKEIGDYEKALINLEHYTTMQDSFFTERSEKMAQELEAKYEREKQDGIIARSKKIRTVLLALLAIFIGLMLLLVRAYRLKNKTNFELERTNEQKEFLIKEIHHRVKNNLQVLSSLLNLQSDYIQDENALDAVVEGRNRVESMGLIHQKLYTGDHLASVDMEDYVMELSENLLYTFGKEDSVQIKYGINVPRMDVDTAIPLGLIINELITNALKYAFSGDQKKAEIVVQMNIDSNEKLVLTVKDNGQGISDSSFTGNSTSFGMDLVSILSKKLKGKMERYSDDGYKVRIDFERFKVAV